MLNLNDCVIFDDVVKYKELNIYPAIMREYFDFYLCVNCLLLDKNSVPNPDIISMSYLRYLMYISKNEEMPYLSMFTTLLKMVLRKEDDFLIRFITKNNDREAFFIIDGVEYDSEDFLNIRKIIFEQNLVESIDETISKEVRDAMNKAQEYKMKQNANKMCSLEDQMICVSISSSYKLEDIYRLPIRKFSKMLERIDHKLHYEIYKTAEMSGMVKFKDGDSLKHWMSDLYKDKYSDVMVDVNEINQKIEGVNSPK